MWKWVQTDRFDVENEVETYSEDLRQYLLEDARLAIYLTDEAVAQPAPVPTSCSTCTAPPQPAESSPSQSTTTTTETHPVGAGA